MKKLLIIAASIALLMTGCNEDAPIMVKDKDGNVYKTVKIANQVWMAQNLKVQTEDSWCYENDPANCEKYGRLYTWSAATNACPEGWSLPNNEDWETLKNFAEEKEGSGKAGKFLKIGGASGLGFLLAGDKYSKKFQLLDSTGYYWSSTDEDATHAYDWVLFASKDDMIAGNIKYGIKANGLSVRCIMKSGIKSDDQAADGAFEDSRDGKTYKTVKIGNQTWMAQNLNVKTEDSWCFGNNPANCEKYGRIYAWRAAKNACPRGWHLPSMEEWEALFYEVGGQSTAGKKLKSSSGWKKNYNGTDDFGFSVLPPAKEGRYTSFWSSTEHRSDDVYLIKLTCCFDGVNINLAAKDAMDDPVVENGTGVNIDDAGKDDEGFGGSVRCLQDYKMDRPKMNTKIDRPKISTVKDSRDGKTYKTVKIGKQTWMAENLNYKMQDSYCNKDNESNCEKYGRLYTWSAAVNACPEDWHLPSNDEWDALFYEVGGFSTAGKKLKSTSGWVYNGNGTDDFVFSVLPAGTSQSFGKGYIAVGYSAGFWSYTKNVDNIHEYIMDFHHDYDYVYISNPFKNEKYSVRCLKD